MAKKNFQSYVQRIRTALDDAGLKAEGNPGERRDEIIGTQYHFLKDRKRQGVEMVIGGIKVLAEGFVPRKSYVAMKYNYGIREIIGYEEFLKGLKRVR